MILVGGVGQLWQGDLDLGRRAAERLAPELAGPGVVVEDLYYGAVAVTQLLEDLRPDVLILVGATERGRPPGTVELRRIGRRERDRQGREDVQGAVADAVTGYVGTDLLLDVAAGLGALPRQTVVIDVEPATTEPGDTLSPEAADALAEAIDLVRAEVVACKPRGGRETMQHEKRDRAEHGANDRRTPAGARGQTDEGIWTAPAAPGTPLTTPPGRPDAPDPKPETERGRLPLTEETGDESALMISEDEDPRVDEDRQRKLVEAWRKARTRDRG